MKEFITRHKLALAILGSLLVVFTWSVLENTLDARRNARADAKIEELKQQVETLESQRDTAIGERNAHKSEADALIVRIVEVTRASAESDVRLRSLESELNNERRQYAKITNARANRPDADAGVELQRACAGLRKAGLLGPNDPCK
jgi:chromosome segregation ATPase